MNEFRANQILFCKMAAMTASFSDVSYDIFKEFLGLIFSVHFSCQMLQVANLKLICTDSTEI